MMEPQKILLLPICGLGDAVSYVPFLQAARARFPRAEIVVVVATAAAGTVLKDNADNVEVVVFNRSSQRQPGRYLLHLIASFRRRRFDIVISGAHPDSARIPVFALLSGAKRRIGAKSEKLGFFYNCRVDVPTDSHYVDRYRSLFQAAGIDVTAAKCNAEIRPPLEGREAARKLWEEAGLADGEMVIGIVSGADVNVRGRWQPYLKRWKNERYAEVVNWAAGKLGARVVMIGSATEAAFADDIAALSGVPIVNFCGKTGLRELQWIITRCTAVVSNDTGTMHLAGALGTPVLALFGPTSPASFKPPGAQNRIIQGHAACSPCYPYPACHLKECLAMDAILPARVIDGLSMLLESAKTMNISRAEAGHARSLIEKN